MKHDNKKKQYPQPKDLIEDRQKPVAMQASTASTETIRSDQGEANHSDYYLQRANLKILAAIPCYNTASSIGDVVTRTLKYVNDVIVIDDGSSDKTAEIASAAGAKIISHGLNKGYGAAIKSCIEAFQASDADILVTIDGDGQHNPDEIPLLINPVIKNKADLVIGSRFMEDGLNIPRYRKFGIGIINFLWNFGSKIQVTDSQSGYRIYNKRIVRGIILRENGMSLSIEILEKIRNRRPIIIEVPIVCSYEDNNSKLDFKAFKHGIAVSLALIKIRIMSLFG